jgi:hypothetical protein
MKENFMEQKNINQKNRDNEMFMPKMIFGLSVAVAVLLLFVYAFMPTKYDPNLASYYSNKYCTIIRPAGSGWMVEKYSESLIFRKSNNSAAIILDMDSDSKYKYCGVDLNKVFLKNKTAAVLTTYKLPKDEIQITKAQETKHEWVIPAVNYEFTMGNYDGLGLIFYTQDVMCVYIAIWEKGDEQYRYAAKTCRDYISLKNQYAAPLFIRPFINTGKPTDYLELQFKAQNKIRLAKALWKNRKANTNNMRLALEAFQDAFKLLAEADDMAFAVRSETMELYKKCKQARKAQIDKQVSEIIQQARLGNDELARKKAKHLINMASIETEGDIREWAKQQYNNLKLEKK